MTTLGAALGSTAQQMRIDAPVTNPASYYQIDDEVVQLLSDRQASQTELAGDRTLWRVERGVVGTTAASHLNGATLIPLYPQLALSPVETGGAGGVDVTDGVTTVSGATAIQLPAGTVSDAGGGTAAVGLISQMVGPFNVVHSAEIAADWVRILDLPNGSILERLFVFGVVDFLGVGTLDFAVGDAPALTIIWEGTSDNPPATDTPPPDLQRAIPSADQPYGAPSMTPPILIGPTGNNGIYVTTDSAGTQGEANVYVVLATPAS